MNVLALDQASGVSGYAFGTPELGCIACGEIDSRSRYVDIGGQLLKFEGATKRLIEKFKPEAIVFEAHRAHSGTTAAQMLGAWSATVMKIAREQQIPYIGVEVGTWKKVFTGTPRADKRLVMAVAKKKYPGLPINRQDTADAVGILHGAFAQL